jgi:hypothetical protein
MKRIFAKRKKQIHEHVPGLLQLGLLGSLLIVSSQYNYKQPEQKQSKSKFVSADGVKSHHKDKLSASEFSQFNAKVK